MHTPFILWFMIYNDEYAFQLYFFTKILINLAYNVGSVREKVIV